MFLHDEPIRGYSKSCSLNTLYFFLFFFYNSWSLSEKGLLNFIVLKFISINRFSVSFLRIMKSEVKLIPSQVVFSESFNSLILNIKKKKQPSELKIFWLRSCFLRTYVVVINKKYHLFKFTYWDWRDFKAFSNFSVPVKLR